MNIIHSIFIFCNVVSIRANTVRGRGNSVKNRTLSYDLFSSFDSYYSEERELTNGTKTYDEYEKKQCSLIFAFDTEGVEGEITATYLGKHRARILAYLELGEFQPTSTEEKIELGSELNWHIHAAWKNEEKSSGSNDECSSSITSGHYDPTYACNCASEHANDDGVCFSPKNEEEIKCTDYKCTPKSNFNKHCEVGDVSGKLGPFKVRKNKKDKKIISFYGIDPFFIHFDEVTENTSIVVHFGSPRILCAKARKVCT